MPFSVNDVDAIFAATIELPSPDERADYVQRVCGENAELRQRVDELLAAHFAAGDFLEPPNATVLYRDDDIQEGPSTVIGPYKLLQQIGEGGMGVVFMAEQSEPIQRTVALKIIKPGMDTRQVIARFEAERQALAMMDHPNIAKVLDAGTTDSGRPYFVMELVKGVPITKYCDEKQLSLRQRLKLIKPVCEAVQHAHQKGIIHRDLKPTNVLVAEYDNRAIPKVIDFGVAKATAQKLTERTMFTEFGQVIGTVEYMSPEQAKFNQLDIDTRSDIYSLGVLLYELLTGSTPFERERLREAAFDEVLRIIREEEPPKPSTRLGTSETLPSIAANRHTEPARLSRDVSGELDWIVMKCLEKDRNRRYETANALASDIERYLHDEPVQACPPSAAYRFRKFARRNKAALAVASAAVAMLLLLVTALAVSNRLITAERNDKAAALKEKELALAAAETSEQAARRNAKNAEDQRKRAEDALLRANVAMREVLSKATMGTGEWATLPPALRQRFAEEVLHSYEGLLQERDRGSDIQYEAALAARSTGEQHAAARRINEALVSFRRSIDSLHDLTTKYPADPQYRQQLAWTYFTLARTLIQQNDFVLAHSTLQKSADLYEQLLRSASNFGNCRNELALCCRVMADLYVRDQNWTDATSKLKRTVELSPDDHVNYHTLAALLVRVGDAEGYRRHCREAQRRFARTENQAVAERIAKSCLMVGDSALDLKQISSLAEFAVTPRNSKTDRTEYYIKWFQATKALAEYRLANFESAIEWARKSGVTKTVELGNLRCAQANCVMAMALYHLKQKSAAQKALQDARAAVSAAPSLKNEIYYGNSGVWADWLTARLLFREAEALIEGSSSTTDIADNGQSLDNLNALLAEGRSNEAVTLATDSPELQDYRLAILAVIENWAAAAEETSRILERDSADDRARIAHAVVLLKCGRLEEYRSLCHDSLQRAANADDVFKRYFSAKAALLLPVADSDFDLACRFADNLPTKEGAITVYANVLKPLTEYRRQRFESAIESAARVIELKSQNYYTAAAWSIQAASHARLKQLDQANTCFINADELIKNANHRSDILVLKSSWREWIIADLMRREAAKLLGITELTPFRALSADERARLKSRHVEDGHRQTIVKDQAQ